MCQGMYIVVGIWESKTRLCLRSVRGWGMRGRQGPTVPHSEMVAVQKDTASNLAWRRDGLFLLVGFFFFLENIKFGRGKESKRGLWSSLCRGWCMRTWCVCRIATR